MTHGPEIQLTPELKSMRKKGQEYHPSLPGIEFDSNRRPIYKPSMQVPSIDDKKGILEFYGIDDEMVSKLLQSYAEKYPSDPDSLVQQRQNPEGIPYVGFPLAARLLDLWDDRDSGDLFDYEDTYEGYVRKGIEQGLKPEFALWCGLHPEDPRYTPALENHWHEESPMYYADKVALYNFGLLESLWEQQLQLDLTSQNALKPGENDSKREGQETTNQALSSDTS